MTAATVNCGAGDRTSLRQLLEDANTVRVEGVDAERIVRLMDVLEELDDVSKVFSNFDIDAAQLAEAEA